MNNFIWKLIFELQLLSIPLRRGHFEKLKVAQFIKKYSPPVKESGLPCCLWLEFPFYRSRGPGSFIGATKFSEN
jgi:hypothetical protein